MSALAVSKSVAVAVAVFAGNPVVVAPTTGAAPSLASPPAVRVAAPALASFARRDFQASLRESSDLIAAIRTQKAALTRNGMADRFSRNAPGDKPQVSLKARLFGETVYDSEGRKYYAKYSTVAGEGYAKHGSGYFGGIPYLVREIYDGNGRLIERREWRDD